MSASPNSKGGVMQNTDAYGYGMLIDLSKPITTPSLLFNPQHPEIMYTEPGSLPELDISEEDFLSNDCSENEIEPVNNTIDGRYEYESPKMEHYSHFLPFAKDTIVVHKNARYCFLCNAPFHTCKDFMNHWKFDADHHGKIIDLHKNWRIQGKFPVIGMLKYQEYNVARTLVLYLLNKYNIKEVNSDYRNAWVKKQLIGEIMKMISENHVSKPRVLDLCCGKGNDLEDWQIAKADSMVMADIAGGSMNQAKILYDKMSSSNQSGQWFKVQFVAVDCTQVDLAALVEEPTQFDFVCCQLALHSFVEEKSARKFLENATVSLKTGRYLIGTLPDADRIVWGACQDDRGLKNSVCSAKSQPALFGNMFNFNFDSQVNCPEFLAYFPLLQDLLEELDMELVFVRKFPDAIKHYQDIGRALMGQMQALEPYPSAAGVQLAGSEGEYARAMEFAKTLDPAAPPSVGPLSESEWQACCMYLVFAFRKRDHSKVEAEDATAPVKEEVKSEEGAEEPLAKKAKHEEPETVNEEQNEPSVTEE